MSDPNKQCQNLMPFNTFSETQLWFVCKFFAVYYFSNIWAYACNTHVCSAIKKHCWTAWLNFLTDFIFFGLQWHFVVSLLISLMLSSMQCYVLSWLQICSQINMMVQMDSSLRAIWLISSLIFCSINMQGISPDIKGQSVYIQSAKYCAKQCKTD